MKRSLDGKVAFITGCARGIGQAVASRFAQAGAGLALFDLRREPLAALAKAETGSGSRVLLNVAGSTGPTAFLEDISLAEWEETFAVNLTSSLLGTKGKALRTPYSASKWAVLGLSRSIALEVGPFNIRVNTICPGTVEGERIDRVRRLRAEAEHTTVDASAVTGEEIVVSAGKR